MKKTKKMLSGLLGITMCLSLISCGDKQEDFTDYGNVQSGEVVEESAGTSDKTNQADSQEDSQADSQAVSKLDLSEFKWFESSLSIKEKKTTANVTIMAPDATLKKYEAHIVDDFGGYEQNIINAVFGGTAKKIEKLSYKDSSSYITFLYKYRLLMYYLGDVDRSYETYLETEKPINSTFKEEYKWMDTDDYYIHMYEGTYNDCKYGLILAYSFSTHTRYLFLDPISIDEYFPGTQYKTVNLTSGTDSYGTASKMENTCEYSVSDAKNMAEELLKNQLGMDLNGCEFSDEYSLAAPELGTMGSWFIYNNSEQYDTAKDDNSGEDDEHLCSLIFSSDDVLTTVKNDGRVVPTAGYLRIAEQEYDIPEGKTFAECADMNLNGSSEGNYVTDGYALFLNPEFSSSGALSNSMISTGAVKITSKGIYGADIVQRVVIDDMTDELNCISVEEMEESIVSELDRCIDMEKMKNPDTLQISNGSIKYAEVPNEESDGEKCTVVPCVSVYVIGGKAMAEASFSITDGKLVTIYYYDL